MAVGVRSGPLIARIMVTIGLGALLRGRAAFTFAGIPDGIPLPIAPDPLAIHGVPVSRERLVAPLIAAAWITAVSWFFRATRAGVALCAVADSQQVAQTVDIDVDRAFAITWALAGLLSVLAGTLWTFVSDGGFGVVLVGLKVFPVVIIGGLESIAGTLVGAVMIGVLESLAAGYLDAVLGGGFSSVASYLVLLAVLFLRPYGLFGRPDVERV
jgi:branched-chain amino acid transport system permease protein